MQSPCSLQRSHIGHHRRDSGRSGVISIPSETFNKLSTHTQIVVPGGKTYFLPVERGRNPIIQQFGGCKPNSIHLSSALRRSTGMTSLVILSLLFHLQSLSLLSHLPVREMPPAFVHFGSRCATCSTLTGHPCRASYQHIELPSKR